ncbi:MAG: sigma-70 family RNA polymerase sigma factor [Planctomycetota bacterium]
MKHEHLSSIELLKRARNNSTVASRTLLVRFKEPLLDRIRLMMGKDVRRMAESEDFLHEVMVDFLDASKSVKAMSEADILSWMTAVARNNIRDVGRRMRVRAFNNLSTYLSKESIRTPKPTPGSLVAQHEEAIRLAEGIEKLKEDYREVIELHHFEGMSLKVIASRMERSYEAVKKLHTRAIVQLGLNLE